MKQFLIFTFEAYYPTGGMNDCIAKCDTVKQAKNKVTEIQHDDLFMGCIQIYDIKNDTLISIDELWNLKH